MKKLLPKAKYPKAKYEEISDKENLVFIDIETTGLNAYADYILEFAGIKYSNGIEIERMHIYIDNGINFKFNPTKTITGDMVKNETKPKQAISKIVDFIGDYTIVGHNIKFDMSFINNEYENNFNKNLDNKTICTMHLARYKFPNMPSHNLDNVSYMLDIEIDETKLHHAMYDIEKTISIFKKLILAKREQIIYFEQIGKAPFNFDLGIKEIEIFKKYKVFSKKTILKNLNRKISYEKNLIFSEYIERMIVEESLMISEKYFAKKDIKFNNEILAKKGDEIDKEYIFEIKDKIFEIESKKIDELSSRIIDQTKISFQEITENFEYDVAPSFSEKKDVYVFTKDKYIGKYKNIWSAYKKIFNVEIATEKIETEMRQILKVIKTTKKTNKKFSTSYGYIWTWDKNLKIEKIKSTK